MGETRYKSVQENKPKNFPQGDNVAGSRENPIDKSTMTRHVKQDQGNPNKIRMGTAGRDKVRHTMNRQGLGI